MEGNTIYVADTNNHCIRKINICNPALQYVQTVSLNILMD